MRKKINDIWSEVKTRTEGVPVFSIILLVLFALPMFFAAPSWVRHETIKSSAQKGFLDVIPVRAVALSNLTAYQNKDLTGEKEEFPAKTLLNIKKLLSIDGKQVFQLSNGEYTKASAADIGSDVTLSVKEVSTTVYTTENVDVLYNPLTTIDNQVYSNLPSGQSLHADKKAETHWGTYYEVTFNGGEKGWIGGRSVTDKNPRMLALQSALRDKYAGSDIAVYVKQLDNNLTATVNPGLTIYSASLAKLPILLATQIRLNENTASLSDQLKYVAAINDTSWGAFPAEGTGSLAKTADDQNYSLSDLINLTAKESDNVASNLLAYYETNQLSTDFQKRIEKIAGERWDPKERMADVSTIAKILLELYKEGGASFNALFDTDFDNSRIMAGVPQGVSVAHKIGITDEENHDAAIVFADRPYILVIETQGSQPDTVLSDISSLVYQTLNG